MHHRIDALHHGLDLGEIGEIGPDDLFAGARRIERRDVGEPKDRVAPAQALAQASSDVAGRAGDQNAIHVSYPCPDATA